MRAWKRQCERRSEVVIVSQLESVASQRKNICVSLREQDRYVATERYERVEKGGAGLPERVLRVGLRDAAGDAAAEDRAGAGEELPTAQSEAFPIKVRMSKAQPTSVSSTQRSPNLSDRTRPAYETYLCPRNSATSLPTFLVPAAI